MNTHIQRRFLLPACLLALLVTGCGPSDITPSESLASASDDSTACLWAVAAGRRLPLSRSRTRMDDLPSPVLEREPMPMMETR